jgi:hypothetical protein
LLFQRLQAHVDRRVQVAGGVAGGAGADLAILEHGNPLAGLRQQHCGRETRDAGADNHDVDVKVALQGRVTGTFIGRALPYGCSVHRRSTCRLALVRSKS